MSIVLLPVQYSSVCGHASRLTLRGREKCSYQKKFKGRTYVGMINEIECEICNKDMKVRMDQAVYRKHRELEGV